LKQDNTEKKGQIAHLDHDPSNNEPDNLVFLCFDHHDQYDTPPSQAKGLTIEEVKRYRTELSLHFAPPSITFFERAISAVAIAGMPIVLCIFSRTTPQWKWTNGVANSFDLHIA